MSRTTFSGPVRAGNIRNNAYKNVGSATLSQSVQVPFNTTLTSTSTPMYIPAGSHIIDIRITTTVVYDSATSATLTVGKTAAGTEYAGGNAKTAGLVTTTVSAAQAANWLATPSDVTSTTTGSFPTSVIYAQIISVGQPTAGNAVVTVQYEQPDDRSTYNTQ